MIISSFLSSPIKHNLKRGSLKMAFTNPLPGIDIGIPLCLFENIYTQLHYGENILNSRDILLQFLLGYYVYGYDRYEDALDYNKNNYITTKKDLYDYIYANKEMMLNILNFTYILIIYLFVIDDYFYYNLPFIGLLELTKNYKQIKENIGIFKPVFISLMWTICAIWIPCIMHDNNYSIINYPLDYLPCTFTLFAASNIVDIKDIDEDINNNITTIAVKYGETNSNIISMLSLVTSSVLLGINHNYLVNPLLNSITELQNGAISFLPFVLNLTLH